MAIPGSGAISMSMFNTELGRASNTANSSLAGGTTPAVGSLFWLGGQSGSLNQTAPHAMSEWYGYTATQTDTIAGSFTVTNSGFSYDSLTVSLGGCGTGGTVTVGNTSTFSPTCAISSPISFTVTDVNGTGTVSVNSDTLACTNATVSVTGNNTTTITITVTPTNYDGSTDTMSGDITITNLP